MSLLPEVPRLVSTGGKQGVGCEALGAGWEVELLFNESGVSVWKMKSSADGDGGDGGTTM